MPKMHQNTFGSRAPLGPTGGTLALPIPPSRNQGGLLLRRGEGKGERKGRKGRDGREEEEGKDCPLE